MIYRRPPNLLPTLAGNEKASGAAVASSRRPRPKIVLRLIRRSGNRGKTLIRRFSFDTRTVNNGVIRDLSTRILSLSLSPFSLAPRIGKMGCRILALTRPPRPSRSSFSDACASSLSLRNPPALGRRSATRVNLPAVGSRKEETIVGYLRKFVAKFSASSFLRLTRR